jgi:threonine aldolase
VDEPSTNMVFFDVADSVKLTVSEIEAEMKKRGVLIDDSGKRRFRFVTHYWIDDAAVEKTIAALKQVIC